MQWCFRRMAAIRGHPCCRSWKQGGTIYQKMTVFMYWALLESNRHLTLKASSLQDFKHCWWSCLSSGENAALQSLGKVWSKWWSGEKRKILSLSEPSNAIFSEWVFFSFSFFFCLICGLGFLNYFLVAVWAFLGTEKKRHHLCKSLYRQERISFGMSWPETRYVSDVC